MGNIGRPSTGCGLCRKRRVKCDEGRPGCRNCARLKKPCPGYREPGYGLVRTTIFVSSIDKGHKTAHSRVALQQVSPSITDVDSDSSQGSTTAPRGRKKLEHQGTSRPTPRSMNTSPDDFILGSVCYSLQSLDINSRVHYGNHAFDFLPTVLSQAGQDSCVYAAMRSVGAINFANRSPTIDLQPMVDLEYSRAVSSVTAALADPAEYLKDETLVAVWLLAMRELLVGLNGPTRADVNGVSMYQTHVDGTLMLLRLRGEEQFSRPEGRHLYSTLLSAMHWRPLFTSEEPTEEYLQLESQISKATTVPTASQKLHTFFHGTCKLRSRIKNFLFIKQDRASLIDRQKIVGTYLKAASRLEEKMLGWCDIPSWMPQKVDLSSAPGLPRTTRLQSVWTTGSLFRLHSFETWTGFFHWNRYFVAKILLHGALLDALSVLAADATATSDGGLDFHALVQQHTAIIHETVRGFLGTLAYAFGDVDGAGQVRSTLTPALADGLDYEFRGIDIPATLQIQPPLLHLISFRYLGPGQREAIMLALQRVQAEFSLR